MKSRVCNVEFEEVGGVSTVFLHDWRRLSAVLVVGTGINSGMREHLVRYPDKPSPKGDVEYRLLLKVKDIIWDLKLKAFGTDPEVN